MPTPILPELPETWEPTRATLHAYAHAVGVIPRAHAIAHPRWWHVSLRVRPAGLVTSPVPLPGGGSMDIRMDLRSHEIVVESSTGARETVPMNAGMTATAVGDALIDAATRLGLSGPYERKRFEGTDDRPYDEDTATLIFRVFTDVAATFERRRVELGDSVGPVQVWPHGFDLAFEWFGTRTESHEEEGEPVDYPSQINLGFYPAGEPYFYSNPWPFEPALTAAPLPHGATWHTDGWEGSTLPYAAVAGDPDGVAKVTEYARAVFEVAAPTLM